MEPISNNDVEDISSESSSELLHEEDKKEIIDESNLDIKDLTLSEITINHSICNEKLEVINFHNTDTTINELFLKMTPIQLFEYLFGDFMNIYVNALQILQIKDME